MCFGIKKSLLKIGAIFQQPRLFQVFFTLQTIARHGNLIFSQFFFYILYGLRGMNKLADVCLFNWLRHIRMLDLFNFRQPGIFTEKTKKKRFYLSTLDSRKKKYG